jgi:phage/plasmid-like protein (TIGR03299 family)
MAHAISTESGQAEAMYAEKPAWHGLGTVVEEAPNSAEAIRLAHLDWTVKQEKMYLGDERADYKDRMGLALEPGDEVPIFRANVRSDTRKVLGVVTKKYTPVQNVEAFRFVDSLVDSGEVRYESAGALFDGSTVWLLARLTGEDREIADGDEQRSYVLFANTHDGSKAVQIIPTNVRVVCWNTLNFALSNGKSGTRRFSIRHVGNVMGRIDAAREALGMVREHFHDYLQLAETLVRRQLAAGEFNAYVDTLFPVLEGQERFNSPIRKTRRIIEGNFRDDHRQDLGGAITNTAWAALNAVTQYHDHDRRVVGKTARAKDESRVFGSWMGEASKAKAQAAKVAAEMFAPALVG